MNFIPLNGWPQLKDIPEKLEHFREVYARFAKVNRWYRSIEETELTGNPVIFEKALKLNALEVGVDLLPIQSGSGDPSPTNVRPISGRTAVAVDDVGKNIWPFGDFIGTYSDVPFSLKAGTYTASKANHDINCGLRFYYADGTSIAFTFFTSETFTLTADVVKINYSSVSATTVNFQLERGSTATPYVPYAHSSATIQLGQTVYGGTLDVKTGVLTIDRAIVSYSGSESESWILATNDRMYIPISGALSGGWDVQQASIANEFKYNTAIYNTDATGYYIAQANLYVRKSGTTTVEDFKTFLASNPLTLVYELATPQTVQLTGAELEMLKGYNLISTDADSLTVKAYTI